MRRRRRRGGSRGGSRGASASERQSASVRHSVCAHAMSPLRARDLGRRGADGCLAWRAGAGRGAPAVDAGAHAVDGCVAVDTACRCGHRAGTSRGTSRVDGGVACRPCVYRARPADHHLRCLADHRHPARLAGIGDPQRTPLSRRGGLLGRRGGGGTPRPGGGGGTREVSRISEARLGCARRDGDCEARPLGGAMRYGARIGYGIGHEAHG